MRSADVRRCTRRVAVAQVALLVAFGALGARAAYLSVLDPRGALRAAEQGHRLLTLPAARGSVVDRAGAELALSVDAPSVYALPWTFEGFDETVRALAEALDLDARRLAARLSGRLRFTFVARWVPEERAERVRAMGLAGVGVVSEPRRVYPHGRLAAPVIGFANIDGLGVRGIEQQEDAWLRGSARRLPVERDARGRLLVSSGSGLWGTQGGDVALTLDAAFQADAEAALLEGVAATGARGGVAIALDPFSGDVLALAEAPGFDPNAFRDTRYADTRSRAFLDAMEPGSALKPFLVAAALESGAIAVDEIFDGEDGAFRIPGKTIRDSHAHEALTTGDVLRVSSNIGAVKIAQALGPRAHERMLRRFGFGVPIGSGFPDEAVGLLRPASDWRPVDHAAIAFGQGLSIPPIQMAAAVAALANGGRLFVPRLVAARRAGGSGWQQTRPRVARTVVSAGTASRVLSMLESVVGPGGTGWRAALTDIRVAGKTGTAQKLDPETGGYAEDRFLAWFVGIAPADAPRLAITVVLDEPQRPRHTGGAAAAPVFARLASGLLARLGIRTEPAVDAPQGPPPRAPAAAPIQEARRDPEPAPAPLPPLELPRFGGRALLPDLRGYAVDDVVTFLHENGLDARVFGRGRAVEQDPPPGSVLLRGDTIEVHFQPTSRRTGET